MAKGGCEIILIGDIGEKVKDEVFQDENKKMTDAEIVGITHLDRYKSCLTCKARVEPSNASFGRCSREDEDSLFTKTVNGVEDIAVRTELKFT